jgi:hypothetical protein
MIRRLRLRSGLVVVSRKSDFVFESFSENMAEAFNSFDNT